jgi:hypothetical protein
MCARLSTTNSSERIFIKVDDVGLYQNLSAHYSFGFDWTAVMGILKMLLVNQNNNITHTESYIFMKLISFYVIHASPFPSGERGIKSALNFPLVYEGGKMLKTESSKL